MSTRSRIGIQLNNSIVSVYHHSDGYPEWLGKTLNKHYNTEEQVTELIDGGDMSCCWTTKRWNSEEEHEYGAQYYSQRGEDVPPRMDESLKEYLSNGEEYAYLFDNGKWTCYDLHGKTPKKVTIPAQ